jgi:copper chaperone CopZ
VDESARRHQARTEAAVSARGILKEEMSGPFTAAMGDDVPASEVVLKTTGMHCGSCARLIEMSVGGLDGVTEVTVDLGAGETRVLHDDAVVDVARIVSEIERAGYGASQA